MIHEILDVRWENSYSFPAPPLYSEGENPAMRLNTRLKLLLDPKPAICAMA